MARSSDVKALLSPDDLLVGARFVRALPGFLGRPVSSEEARATVRRRLERREPTFLANVQRGIYQQPGNPSRALLRLAGCEVGDLERLVRQEGIEGALHTLYLRGVYLSVEEFKGRQPAVRGSATVSVNPSYLRNPAAAYHLLAQSGGSRGARTSIPLDLAFIREHAVNRRLILEDNDCLGRPHAHWALPGAQALFTMLESAGHGHPVHAWFASVDPATPGIHPRYVWSARVLHWVGRLCGVRLPLPRYVPLDQALIVARWLAEALRREGRAYFTGPPSTAVRLCQAAAGAGLDLTGLQTSMGAEPLTEARRATMERVGARPISSYGTSESSRLAQGCLAGIATDDLHLYHDLTALIQPGPEGAQPGLPPRALLFTSLSPKAPFSAINVSLGDQADLAPRACGCPLEQHGWTTHLQNIRSFEKLSAGSITFLDTEIIRVLEEVLPARFGGGPIDYQLVESDDAAGRPRLILVVHPRVGPLDPAAVAEAFLAAIGGGSGVERLMAQLSREAGLVSVERRPPHRTVSGKILHLHQERPGR